MKAVYTLVLFIAGFTISHAQLSQAPMIFKGDFMITSVAGEDVSETALSLTIDNKKRSISGTTGCNNYMTDYALRGTALQFSYVANTKRACPHDDIEQLYYDNLSEVTSFLKKGDTITLYRDSDAIITGISKKALIDNNK
ncbi:META domain-containing protein [uncultured Dokdonia sp.]|uniref:META domain-containing protein n=1 Tax=uncultured Dokdonia sp. TaxID=575653 RepID=UPI00260A0207|nr:META domain-containing protein [uncultured Dokdonia sp.]